MISQVGGSIGAGSCSFMELLIAFFKQTKVILTSTFNYQLLASKKLYQIDSFSVTRDINGRQVAGLSKFCNL